MDTVTPPCKINILRHASSSLTDDSAGNFEHGHCDYWKVLHLIGDISSHDSVVNCTLGVALRKKDRARTDLRE